MTIEMLYHYMQDIRGFSCIFARIGRGLPFLAQARRKVRA